MTTAPSYRPVDERLVRRLASIVGPDHVLSADPEALAPYARDETPDYRLARTPEAVVRPASAAEVAEVLRLAAAERVPVTPRGGGTGLAGGAIPLFGGIVLALERMDAIHEIDPVNLMAILGPGVVTARINDAARPHGLFHAGYPMSLDDCHIGGNVATNAGGGKAIKYGVTRRYVTGLEAVTAEGRVLEMGGRLVKNATDAHLLSLLVGSEGTLAVITRIVLKLMPEPRAVADLLGRFRSLDAAIAAVPRVMTETGILPTACEFIDREAYELGAAYVGEDAPAEGIEALLLVTVDGFDEAEVRRSAGKVADLLRRAGADEVETGETVEAGDRLWNIRRHIGSACNEQAAFQGDEDLVVPVSAIAPLVRALGELSRDFGVRMPAYGHAGDGNIHVHILPPADWSLERWDEVMGRLLPRLYGRIAELGGKPSGEHGIGLKRKAYLGSAVSPGYVDALRSVKRALDPAGILNPGKIFDL